MLLAASKTHLLFCTVRKVVVLDTAHSIRIWSPSRCSFVGRSLPTQFRFCFKYSNTEKEDQMYLSYPVARARGVDALCLFFFFILCQFSAGEGELQPGAVVMLQPTH